MMASLLALAVSVAAPISEQQDRKNPPSKGELAAITERGRLLAQYDVAAWHASDAVVALKPKEGAFERYVAIKTNAGWIASFGRLNDSQGMFLISYEATERADPAQFDVKAYDPPKQDTGFVRSAAKAIVVVLADFVKNYKGEPRPHNVALLPANDSQFWVYVVPAQTRPNVWPLGRDVRYLVTADGTRIVAKRQLHVSIIENEAPKDEPNQKPIVGVHTAVLDDIPEDTDVFHVLVRKPAVPEIVVTDQFLFQVEVDGSIEYLGRREELIKQ